MGNQNFLNTADDRLNEDKRVKSSSPTRDSFVGSNNKYKT